MMKAVAGKVRLKKQRKQIDLCAWWVAVAAYNHPQMDNPHPVTVLLT